MGAFFGVSTQPEDLVNTRWALTWKEVEGEKTVGARLVAGGYQDSGQSMGQGMAGWWRAISGSWPYQDPGHIRIQADWWPEHGQCGYCGLREPQILSFASDFPGGPEWIGRFIFVLRARGIPRILAAYGN